MINICDFSYFPLTGAFVQEGMCAIMASLEKKKAGYHVIMLQETLEAAD